MATNNHPKSPSHRKSRWESSSSATATATANNKKPSTQNPKPADSKPVPSPKPTSNPPPPRSKPSPAGPAQSQIPPPGPPPPSQPAYGFHMLDRRTIVLADGSVRSYFALPHDYNSPPQMDPAARFFPSGGPEIPRRPDGIRDNSDFWGSLGDKRKYVNEFGPPGGYPIGPGPGTSSAFKGEEMRAPKHMKIGGGNGNGNGVVVHNKHLEVDQSALKKAFYQFVKLINENPAQKKTYLEDGKQGRIHCVACGRSSKDFPDMHSLILHTYNSDNAELRVDHLGLHKALCVLMGWNYSKPPDNSKAYQFLPADEVAANQEDLIMWPPLVIIHNTVTGKGKDGRVEGLGNKAMDSKIRDMGFGGGKSKSLYGRDGHLGITLVKFAGDQSGMTEAVRFAEYFEKDNHGRKGWARVQTLTLGKDDEKNPNLVKVDERTGDKKRILYGYLGLAADLDKLDYDTRKKVVIESQKEYKASR
ncbi:XS domain-containing protein [Cephalotus follicularis]|uniref:XS domain-containing protein n=1 Tax=Cephalotus follicularis TaxID=3775 RepID=A0A1Q3CXI3_CEPFO|nr:XS domain-containing protein [Cephalotus follicularis]